MTVVALLRLECITGSRPDIITNKNRNKSDDSKTKNTNSK